MSDAPHNPYGVYKRLKEERQTIVAHNPIPYKANNPGRAVILNWEAISKPQEKPAPPQATLEDFIRHINSIVRTFESDLSLAEPYHIEPALIQEIARLSSDFYFKIKFRNLESWNSSKEYDPIAYKLAKCVEILNSIPENVAQGNLSAKEEAILQMMVNLTTCPTGKDDGIESSYNWLTGQHLLEEERMREGRAFEKLKHHLFDILRALCDQTLEGTGKIVYALAELPGDQEIAEPPHQKAYLKNLIGPEIGLFYEGQIFKFDTNAGIVYPKLASLSKQQVLDEFHRHFTTATLIKRMGAYLNENIKQKIVSDGLAALEQFNPDTFFTYDQEQDDYTTLNEYGVLQTLLQVGILKEIEEKKEGHLDPQSFSEKE